MIKINKINLKLLIKSFLGLPITLLSFYFIFSIILKNKENVLFSITHGNLTTIFIGCLFLILFFFIKTVCWNKLLRENGYKTNLEDSMYNYSSSELKRYIPGNIFSFIARTHNFNALGVPLKKSIQFLMLEAVFVILTSSIYIFFSIDFIEKILNITFSDIFQKHIYTAVIILLILFSTLIAISKFIHKNIFIKWFYLRFKSVISNVKINILSKKLFNHVDLFLIYILGWLFFGLGNYFIISSFTYVDVKLFFPVLSFFIVSWLIGYLSFITPMGLGVREAVLGVGLSTILPAHIAFTVPLVLRIFLILSELFFVAFSYMIYKVKKIGNIFNYLIKHFQITILTLSIISYSVYFTYTSFTKHLNFFTGRFDLGNMDQTVWNTINGRIFLLTNPDGTNLMSRLGIHADFILIFLSPFYLIWDDPRMLLLIQTVIISLGALFVYLLARKVINNKNIALALSISYLLNPFVQKQNLFDFHSVSLATTFLLACFYFFYIKKYPYFLIFLFLSVISKENVFLVASIFGIYIIILNNFSKVKILLKNMKKNSTLRLNITQILKEIFLDRKNIFATILFTISLLAFYFLVSKLIPEARGRDHFALSYYSEFGENPSEIIKNIFFEYNKIFSVFFSYGTITYLKNLLMPLGYLSLLSPFHLLFLLPDLFINLLSKNENLRSLHYHYAAVIIPFLYVSAIFGIRKLTNFRYKIINEKFIFYYLLFFSFFATWSSGVLPGSNKPALEIFNRQQEDSRIIRDYLKKIPVEISITSTNNLGAHLSRREKIYTMPVNINESDMVLLLIDNTSNSPKSIEYKKLTEDLINNNLVVFFKTRDFVALGKKDLILKYPQLFH